MNKNNLPRNLSEENIEMVFDAIKYFKDNPIMLYGFSICGLVMATCLLINNKKEND